MAYKVPHYATGGVYIMLKNQNGGIFGLPVSVEEIGEAGIEGVIAEMVDAALERGLSPLSEAEYDTWARELAAEHQRSRLAAGMDDSTPPRAIDPSRFDAIL